MFQSASKSGRPISVNPGSAQKPPGSSNNLNNSNLTVGSASKPQMGGSSSQGGSPIKNGSSSQLGTQGNKSQPNNKTPNPPPKQPLPPMVMKGPVYSADKVPKNTDPSMGGETFRPPTCQGPQSYFNYYCTNTPANNASTRIIPWDHEKKDYVYAAVKEEDLRGVISRKELKSRLDIFKSTDYWDPVSVYNLSPVIVGVLFGISLVGVIIYMIVNWDSAKTYWYVLVFLPIIILLVGIIIVIALRNRANKLTFQRKAMFDEELASISKGSPYKIRSGEASSYIEIFQDRMVPPPIQATDTYKVSVASEKTNTSQSPTRIPLNLNAGDDQNENDNSTFQLNPRGRTPERELTTSMPIPPPLVTGPPVMLAPAPPLSPMSQKKLNFSQRLEAQKQGASSSRIPIGVSSMGYGSVKPEQETVLNPGRSANLNLAIDDSFDN